MKGTLSSAPARQDLTDRECVEILGGSIAALCRMAPVANVQNAMKWWASNKDAWTIFHTVREQLNNDPTEEPEHAPQSWVKQARKNAAKRNAKAR